MAVVVVSFIESLLYYICMVSISARLLGARCSKVKFAVSFLFFVPVLMAGILCGKDIAVIVQGIFQIAEILLVRFALSNARLLSIVSSYIFLFMINTMIVSCMVSFLSVSAEEEWIVEFSVNLLSSAVCLGVCYLKPRRAVGQALALTPRYIKRLLLLLISFCSLLVVLVLSASFFEGIPRWSGAVRLVLVIFITLLSLTLPVIIVYSTTNAHIKNLADSYEQQLNAQSEHYAMLAQSNHELRRFRHDYNNMRIGVSTLISEGENAAAIEMLNSENNILNGTDASFDTGNGIVDALLADKQKQAERINAQIKFEGAVPQKSIRPAELCVLFGNTIDNALEACGKLERSVEKIITVDCACNSGFMFITVTNPVARKVEIPGRLPDTTKPDKGNHGFGLYSIDKVIKQHSGKINFLCDSHSFQVDMELSLL